MNDDLRVFYQSVWLEIESIRSRELDVSRPLLLYVPPSYESASTKVMIVGQETFGWGLPEEDTVELLQAGYVSFDRGKALGRTPFWQAAQTVSHSLNPKSDERCFLWTNLVKVDQASRRPSQLVEDAIADLRIVQREIQITKPDVVIFFTGPHYDDRLRRTFPAVHFVPMSQEIAKLSHTALPARSYRTYHPKYLRMRRKWPVLGQISTDAVSLDVD